ncbi:MAG: FtsX-like permease family protein, partial [Gammaproteobacteria bacterium]
NVAAVERGMSDSGQTFFFLPVDHDFIDVFDLDVLAGRGFSRDFETDIGAAFIVNESAYRALGFSNAEDAVGVELVRQFGDPRDIIGVISDFNYQSLQYMVEPLVLFIDEDAYAFASVKLDTADLPGTIAELERVWHEFEADLPFDFFFLEEDFNNQYHLEIQISRLLQSFTVLAIVIACMGLYALAAFMTQKRRKEVGIRKVLGASVNQITLMLSYSFSKPVLVATVITVPLCWIAGNRWLSTFAARINMSWDIVGIAILLAFLVAMATVAGQAIRAALSNPSRTLRSE